MGGFLMLEMAVVVGWGEEERVLGCFSLRLDLGKCADGGIVVYLLLLLLSHGSCWADIPKGVPSGALCSTSFDYFLFCFAGR